MIELDAEKLRKELIWIYEAYLKNPHDKKMRQRATDVYWDYQGAGPILNDAMSGAVNWCVEIGFDTGVPKPAKEQVELLLSELKNK